MSKSRETIAELYAERLKASHPSIEMMRQIADISNGEMPVALPEMDDSQKPAVANLVAEAIDQTSMRVASTSPNYLVPPGNPRNEKSKEKADLQRMAMIAYAQENRMKRVRRRRARFLSAYGQSAVILRPDFERKIPVWQVRDPFHTFPSPSEFYDDDTPRDCIFGFRKPLGWLKKHYPTQWQMLRKGPKDSYTDDTMFELVEYIDEDCIQLLAIGVKDDYRWGQLGDAYLGEQVVELEYIPNRAGICTVVAPTRITLDKLQGQFNQLIGMYEAQARLVALDLIAVERGIFPDIALVGQNGQTPTLVNGEWLDGRSGGINIVRNGDVKVVNQQPGTATGMASDRLERAQRMGAGVPAQWQGENPSNIRTGRASELTMSATVDFRIQEYQETLAESEGFEFTRAIKLAKGYFGDVPQSINLNAKGAKGKQVNFIPNRDFESDKVLVDYPMPGADANGVVVALGQRLGLGLISREKARWLDPLIDDPDLEHDKVLAEGLEEASLTSLQQMAAEGAIPPGDLAAITKLIVEDNLPLYKAIEEAQRLAEERQSTPAEPMSPEAMPGLAQPGAGAEQPVVEDPGPNMHNLQKILMGLRSPQGQAGGAAPEMVAG